MSYTIDKFGAGDNDSNGDYPLTKNQAKVLLKKLTDQKIFYELEPIEVLDVFVDLEDDFPFTDENDNPDVNRIGTIRGRYVVSEHDQQVEDGYFFPLDQNVIQYPVVGEIVIGFEFNDNRYYFSKLPAELNLPPRSVDFNISNTSGLGNNFNTLNQNTPLDQYRSGRYFTPDKDVTRLTPREGDTIISGRFGNTIRLGHNKIEKSPNIKLVAGGFKYNDEPYFENLQNDNSSIYITTNEKVEYSKPTSDIKELLDIDYDKPQLVFDSDRIVLNSKKDDIAIFSENDVHIKGRRVNIKSNEGVNINGSTIDINFSTETKIDSPKINIGSSSLVSAVLGNEDFIKVVDIILNQQIENNLIEIGEQVASPAPNATLIAQLTEENVDLNRIKNDRTYLSKKINVE